ncbi:MAG: hypothetical protein MZV63_33040 [Marinilabiliales bacterium]|nr:hypothetical protein [Marinilabiliales bacterium]
MADRAELKYLRVFGYLFTQPRRFVKRLSGQGKLDLSHHKAAVNAVRKHPLRRCDPCGETEAYGSSPPGMVRRSLSSSLASSTGISAFPLAASRS